MNSLSDIADALSRDVSRLQADEWLCIPLDEDHEVRLLRPDPIHRAASPISDGAVLAVLARKPGWRSQEQEEFAFTALLKWSAETPSCERWTGGLDDNGWDCITLTLNDVSHSEIVEARLQRGMDRLFSLGGSSSHGLGSTLSWGLP